MFKDWLEASFIHKAMLTAHSCVFQGYIVH